MVVSPLALVSKATLTRNGTAGLEPSVGLRYEGAKQREFPAADALRVTVSGDVPMPNNVQGPSVPDVGRVRALTDPLEPGGRQRADSLGPRVVPYQNAIAQEDVAQGPEVRREADNPVEPDDPVVGPDDVPQVVDAVPPPGAAPAANAAPVSAQANPLNVQGGPAAAQQVANPAWQREKDQFRKTCETWLAKLPARPKTEQLKRVCDVPIRQINARKSDLEKLELLGELANTVMSRRPNRDEHVVVFSQVILPKMQHIYHPGKQHLQTTIHQMVPELQNPLEVQKAATILDSLSGLFD
jgi:hypothetical protein